MLDFKAAQISIYILLEPQYLPAGLKGMLSLKSHQNYTVFVKSEKYVKFQRSMK